MKSTMAVLMMLGSLHAKAAPGGAVPLPPRRDVKPSPSVPVVAIDQSEVGQLIRAQLESGQEVVIGRTKVDGAALKKFYTLRGYRPVWTTDKEISTMGSDLEMYFSDSEMKGLRPSYYETEDLKSRMEANEPQTLSEAELLLTHGFLIYANDLFVGRVNPKDVSQDLKDIEFPRRAPLTMEWLNSMVSSPTNFRKGLSMIEPNTNFEVENPGPYALLIRTMSRLKNAESYGGWPALKGTEVLKPGMTHPNVVGLRIRLVDMGALPFSERRNSSPFFDDTLRAALVEVQKLMFDGAADGIVGPGTYRLLNVSLQQRILQTRANLERWRLFPRKLGYDSDPARRYIMVDMGRQELDIAEYGRYLPEMKMRVVLGQGARQTPNMVDRVSSVIVNPYWNPPKSILIKDILPAAQKNPSYFEKTQMRILRNGQSYDPLSIDWSQYSASNLPPFQFRQDPGYNNSLGVLKFNLGNSHAIYMHDTNHRDLFVKEKRFFSSGCIRVQEPRKLAAYLLRDQGLDESSIQALIDDPNNVAKNIPLSSTTVDGKKRSIPVYIMGTTMNAYQNGLVIYRDDTYGQDRRLVNALDGKRVSNPTSQSSDAPQN